MDARVKAKSVKRLVLCSGKVYVDLISSELRAKTPEVAICRVEQLYPFPAQQIADLLRAYPNAKDVVWLQEEPENAGAWEFMRPLLQELIGDRRPLRYIGRARSASPSEGSATWHQMNQKALVERAFSLTSHGSEPSMVLSKPVGSAR